MKLTGYQLQQAIKARQEDRDLLQGQFSGSLFKFEDEVKRAPTEIADDLAKAELEIAQLQAAQGVYNTKVTITVGGQDISLLQAIKQIGGANRLASLWKGVAQQSAGALSQGRRNRFDPYGHGSVRDKEQEYAKATVSAETAIEKSKATSKAARAMRAAISAGNAKSVEVEINQELLSS
jgi:hypothetical protein